MSPWAFFYGSLCGASIAAGIAVGQHWGFVAGLLLGFGLSPICGAIYAAHFAPSAVRSPWLP